MPTNNPLGTGNGAILDHGNGTIEYRPTGKLMPAFRLNVGDVTGFTTRRPTKEDKKIGAGRLHQVFVIQGSGTEIAKVAVNYGTGEKIEAWIRAHPLFRGNVTQAAPAPIVIQQPQVQATLADQLVQLGQLRDSGVLSPAEFDQAKARLLNG